MYVARLYAGASLKQTRQARLTEPEEDEKDLASAVWIMAKVRMDQRGISTHIETQEPGLAGSFHAKK